MAHVLEHLTEPLAQWLLGEYLPFVRSGGRIVIVTPQERGFVSDDTHVRFVDDVRIAQHCVRLGLAVEKSYSFPFPRRVGTLFAYNEFVVVARVAN